MNTAKPFKMLCIDASTSHFGFAYYVAGKLYSVFGLDVEGNYDLLKLQKLNFEFKSIFEEWKPEHVVLEQPAPVSFSRNLISINQVAGMILSMAIMYGASIDWVHNRTAKKLAGVTKKGKEGKQQGIEIVKALYPKFADKVVSDHIADAVIVGEAYKKLTADVK